MKMKKKTNHQKYLEVITVCQEDPRFSLVLSGEICQNTVSMDNWEAQGEGDGSEAHDTQLSHSATSN